MALAVEAMSTGQPEGTWYCAQPAGQRQEGRGISARGAVRGAGYAPPFAASEALYYGLEDAGPARHAPAGAVLRAPGLAAGPSFAPEFARAFPDYTDGFYSIGGLVVDQWPADPAATLNASFGPDGSGDWSASTSIYTASTASPAESTAYSPSAFTTSPVNTTHGSPNPVCGTPAYLPNSLAAPQIDPLALVYPDLLPSFPYVASAEVASEARVPDIFVEDEGQEGRGAKRVGKRENERLRREAFKMQLNNLTTAIPGLQFHCNTRKAVLVCAREYIAQLQTREKRLRAQLMAHHLRERALVAALLKRGATPQQIADENMLATPSELERVSTAVESMIAESPSGVPGAPSDFQGPQIAQLPQQAPVGKSRPRDRAAPYPVTSTSARRTLF